MSNLFQNLLPSGANDNAFDLDALIASVFDAWFAPDGPLGQWACESASGQAPASSQDPVPPAGLLSLPVGGEPAVDPISPLQLQLPALSDPLPLAQSLLDPPFNWSDFQSGFTDLLDHVNELTDALESAVQNSHSGEEFVASICAFVRDWLSGGSNAGATFTPGGEITQTPDTLPGWLGGYDPYA